MLNILLNILPMPSFKMTLWAKYDHCEHFTGEESEAREENKMINFKQLLKYRAKILKFTIAF